MKLASFSAGVAGGIAIAAAAYTGYWYLAASEIEDRIASWADEQRAQGVAVETGETDISGFPLRFDVAMSNPSIDDPTGGWSWRGNGLRARVRPWNFSEVVLNVGGRNSVRIHDGERWRDIDWVVDGGVARLTLDGDKQISDVALDLQGLEVTGIWPDGLAKIDRLHAHGATFDPSGPAANPEILNAAFALEGVRLPEGFGEELGESIEFLSLEASLKGPLPEGERAEAIIAWRDAGGTLELNSFRVRWGPLGIESAGTIALDGEMRPIGALTADIIGYGDVIDALIMSNLIPLGDAFLAKVAFNMLADKPEDGGPPVLRSVPVTVQNGGLFVGPVAVAKVPPIDIPERRAGSF